MSSRMWHVNHRRLQEVHNDDDDGVGGGEEEETIFVKT